MTVQPPRIDDRSDDRSFDDLVREALARLPASAPEWTNHNASDPGVTLVELFAYFTEILLYRMGRVPAASKLQFLRLLQGQPALQLAAAGARWDTNAASDDLSRAIGDTVRELAQAECAVTAADVERLAQRAASAHLGPGVPVRTLCIPGVHLDGARPGASCRAGKAHVSVVVLPAQALDGDALAALCAAVRRELQPRCLLTTRLHVSGPMYLRAGVSVAVVPNPGQGGEALLREVAMALARRFGAGNLEDGAPLPGRPLYLSEIIATVEQLEGVDYVAQASILQLGTGHAPLASLRSSVGIQLGLRSSLGRDSRLGGPAHADGRLLRSDSGRLVGIRLQPWELLDLVVLENTLAGAGREARLRDPLDGRHDG
ncbi:hypothetical protein LK540_02805 [Massilia sp. IC2-278]|uniref:hypothetical protein n=1 Tax=Massilia sp. IC2-278 TaxID=2887200 RepID=UPI001E463702|nr:hypothetical protein [Massilia sp. IC2-278]MCC2959356.1 hypothetical protein [Massilia sp. IC2-278]